MANNTVRANRARQAAVLAPGAFIPLGAMTTPGIDSVVNVDPVGLGLATDELEDAVNAVMIQALVQAIRYTLDGSTPGAGSFFLAVNATPLVISLTPNTTLRVIGAAAGGFAAIQFGRVEGQLR